MAVPDGFMRVTVRFARTGDPEPYNVVLGYVNPVPFDQAEADAFCGNLAPVIKDALCPQTRFTGMGFSVGVDGGDALFDSVSGAGDGTIGHNDSTPAVCSLVRKSTGVGGRKNRGRMYWPCVPRELVSTNGVFSGGWQGTLQGQMEGFLGTSVLPDGYDMVLFHSDLSEPTVVVSLLVEDRCATQRRRMRS